MINILIVLIAKYLYIISVLVFVGIWICAKPERKKSLVILSLIALPLAFVFARILNRIVINPRPFVVLQVEPLIAHSADNGFPSDHTLLTMTLAAIVYVFEKKWGVALTIIALMVGVARILALVHHPLDITGAILISVIATWIGVLIYKWLKIKNKLFIA